MPSSEPGTGASVTSAAPHRRPRIDWRPTAIAVGFVGLVFALLALPGGTIVGDTTTNIRDTAVLPTITAGRPLIQPFVASQDGLARIAITFGTFGGASRCELTIELRAAAEENGVGTGELLEANTIDCLDIPDTYPIQALKFAPIEDSAGHRYDVVVRRSDAAATDLGEIGAPAVWAGVPEGDAEIAVIEGNLDGLSAAVRPTYDPEPRRWDHLRTTLERLGEYGAGWSGALPYVASLALLGVLLTLTPIAQRSTRTLVLVVCLLALLRGLVWSATVPPLHAMDEPAHFANVQFLAEEGEFPGSEDNPEVFSERLFGAVDDMNVEATTPGARPAYSAGAEEELRAELDSLSPEGGGGGPAAAYGPFYYMGAVPFYVVAPDDILMQLMFSRLWSVLLGVGAAGLLVLLGRQFFPGSSGAQAAFAVAGIFQPMMAHQFAIVNNDAWVITCGFAALAIGLALARRPRATLLVLAGGAVVGAALLGKPFGIAAAAPIGAGWLVGKIRGRERSPITYAKEVAAGLTGILATYGAWRVVSAYLGLSTQRLPSKPDVEPSLREFLLAQIGTGGTAARTMWADQLWGDFGWVRIPLPAIVTQPIFYAEIALVVALCVWALIAIVQWVRRGRRRTGVARDAGRSIADISSTPLPLDVRILLCAVMIASMAGALYAAGFLYYLSSGQNDLLQGRYALLAIPAILAAPALLLERFTAGRVRPVVVNTVLAASMVVLNGVGIVLVHEAFYG